MWRQSHDFLSIFGTLPFLQKRMLLTYPSLGTAGKMAPSLLCHAHTSCKDTSWDTLSPIVPLGMYKAS